MLYHRTNHVQHFVYVVQYTILQEIRALPANRPHTCITVHIHGSVTRPSTSEVQGNQRIIIYSERGEEDLIVTWKTKCACGSWRRGSCP